MNKTERAQATVLSTWDTVQKYGSGDPMDVYGKLHAILCMNHGWDNASAVEFIDFFDSMVIAAELDRIAKACLTDEPVCRPTFETGA